MQHRNLRAALEANAIQNLQQEVDHKPLVKKERSDLTMVMSYLTDPKTREQFNVSLEDLQNDKARKIFKGKDYKDLSYDEKSRVDKVVEDIKGKMFKAFACESDEAKASLKSFLEQNEPQGIIGKFLFADAFKSQFASREEELKREFEDLEQRYGYGHKFEDFQKIHAAINFADQVVEGNIPSETPERAYKAMAIFWEKDATQTTKNINGFIKAFTSKHPNPIHDMFMDQLPTGIKQAEWLNLIKNNGLEVLKEVPRALEIEQDENALEDIGKFREKVKSLKYPRQKENPELAELYSFYEVGNETFERTLDLMKAGQPLASLKKADNLPSVEHKLEGTAKNLWLMKLPAGDKRGLILGKITNCCQSINGHSEQCVIDGMTRSNNGFYVLVELKGKSPKDIKWESFERDGNKILGQGYAWKSRAGNLTFDSWENLNTSANDIDIAKNLVAFTDKIIEAAPSISLVTLGLGGKTPAVLKQLIEKTEAENMQEGYFYGDSSEQIEIGVSQELEELRGQISEVIPESNLNISSVKQAKYILEHQEEVKSTPQKFQWIYSSKSFGLGEEHVKLLQNEIKENPNSLIISYQARAAYQTGKVSVQDLKDLDTEKIELLISDEARAAYETGKVSAEDLKNLPSEKDILNKIAHIILTELGGYKTLDTDSLKNLSEDLLKLLTSRDARAVYKAGKVSAEDLKDLDPEKIELLISQYAIKVYERGDMSAKDLIGLDERNMRLHLAFGVLSSYNNSKELKFDDIKNLPEDKLALLLSRNAEGVYFTGKASALELKNLDEKTIKLLISEDARLAYINGGVSVGDLKNLDIQKIGILISWNARDAYKTGKVSIEDLKDLDYNKIQLLISDNAREVYKAGQVEAEDLKMLDPEKIKLLISRDAIEAYQTGQVSTEDLKNLDSQKITLLISENSRKAYKTGKVSAENLKDLDPEKIELLTSFSTLMAYDSGKVNFRDLNGLDPEKIRLLTSYEAYEAYKTGKVSASDLKDLDPEKIELLTSFEVVEIYNTGKVSASDLKGLGDEEIYHVTSYSSLEKYYEGKTFNDVLGEFRDKNGTKTKDEANQQPPKSFVDRVGKAEVPANQSFVERLESKKNIREEQAR